MRLEDKDFPIIVDKGFELASDLLDPNTFHSIALLQKNKKYGNFLYDEATDKLILNTPEKKISINPNKITEQGVPICKKEDGEIFFKEGKKLGIAMYLDPSLCHPEGVYVASLHTHPGGSPAPSVGDLRASTINEDQAMCIATKINHKQLAVNCYIPKQELIREEIAEVDNRVSLLLNRWMEDNISIQLKNEPFARRIPMYDQRMIKVYASAIMNEVSEFYDIKKFVRNI